MVAALVTGVVTLAGPPGAAARPAPKSPPLASPFSVAVPDPFLGSPQPSDSVLAPLAAGPASVTIAPATASTLSGAPATFTLTVSCSVTPNCAGTVVSFPSNTVTGDGPTTDFGAWVGNSSCASVTKSVSGGQVKFTYGTVATGTMQCTFNVTPPEYDTWNGATLTITPTISGTNFSSATGDPAALTVTASHTAVLQKGGPGSVGTGGNFSYSIAFVCGTSGNGYRGDIGTSSLTITDQLPANFTYTGYTPGGSAQPLPGTFSYDSATRTLTYSDPTGKSCDTYPNPYVSGPNGNNEITFTINGTASTNGTPDAIGTKICNQASSTFSYVDGTQASSTSTNFCPTVVALVPQQFVQKGSFGTTLPNAGQYRFQNDNGAYPYTFPGDWDNSGTSVTWQVNLLANALNAGVDYAVKDPLPCLDNLSNHIYNSPPPGAPYCQHPAFIPTKIGVPGGFTPTASDSITLIYTDGTSDTVPYVAGTGWTIPTTQPVAEIDLPPFPEEGNNASTTMSLFIVGYSAPSVQTNTLLHNIVSADAYLVGSNTTISPQATYGANVLVVDPAAPSGAVGRAVITSGYNGPGTCKEAVNWSLYGSIAHGIEVAHAPSKAITLDYLAPVGATVTAGLNGPITLQQTHAGGFYNLQWGGPFPGAAKYVTPTINATVTPNFHGTGRTLYEWVIPAGTITQPGDYAIQRSGLAVDLGLGCAGTYQNDFTLGYGDPIAGCFQGGLDVATKEGPPPVNPPADSDLNYNGDGSSNYCGYSAPLTVTPTNPGFRVDKTVQGNLDPAAVGAGGTGTVGASGGAATYSVTFKNTGQSNLVDPVMYDILPAVGDTQASSPTPRGSQFAVTLTGVGPVPPGVTVSYSQSANPCRPEVLATNPGCVNDWTTTPPSPLSSVKALKFSYAGTVFVSGASGTNSFTVPFSVATPSGTGGDVAWNTVGTNAHAGAGGPLVGAAESSRTGLQALTGPTITKTTSTAGYAHPGDRIDYTFTLTNNTAVPLTAVRVADNLVAAPAGDTAPAVTCQSLSSPAASCSGPATTLQPGQKATFTASYAATQGDVDAGSIADTATVTATPPFGGDLTNTSSKVTVPATESPTVSIVKHATVTPAADQGGVKVGDQIAYSYTVKNTGNVTLQKVSVSDPALGSVTCPTPPAPGLAVGAAETCTAAVQHLVTQDDVDTGHVDDSATAGCTAVTGDSCPTSAPSAVSVPATTARPSVAIHKIASSSRGDTSPIQVGDTIQYSYLVTNDGNVTLASVAVDDPTGGHVSCPSVGAGLAPGDSVTCAADTAHVVTQADVDAGTVTDTATATGTDTHGTKSPPSAPSSTATPSDPKPRVAIDKHATVTPAADQQSLKLGDTVAYSYKVTNIGNTTLGSVAVDDPTGGHVTCPAPGAPGLAPGESITCAADAAHTVSQHDVDAGGVTDTATATGTDTAARKSPESDPSTITIPALANPLVTIDKSAAVTPAADQGGVKVADTIAYSYTVTNAGNVTLTSVSVSDPAGGAVTCPSGTLAPGASVTCTADAEHTVTQAEVDAGHVDDTATARGTDAAGHQSPLSAPSTVTVPAAAPAPAIALVKTAAVTPAAHQSAVGVGDVITYAYKVTNAGNVTVHQIGVDDPALGTVTCPQPAPPGLAPGASITCAANATHPVTQADVDAGHVDDTATAAAKDPSGTDLKSGPSTVSIPAVAAAPAVTLRKVADASAGDQADIFVGETIRYSYLVTNTGNVTLASLAVDDPTGGSVTCPTPSAPGLAPGQSETCTADSAYTVQQSDVDTGKVTDTATATGTDARGHTSPPSPPDTVTIKGDPKPEVAIDKRATVTPAADQSDLHVGDTIAYSYIVTNIGNVTLQSVAVDDPTIGPVSCPTPDAPGLPPGQSITCIAGHDQTVHQSDVDAGGVSDTATATGTSTTGTDSPASLPSTVTLPAARAPRLTIVKSAAVTPAGDQGAVKAGDAVAYSYLVTNVGNATLASIAVEDPALGHVTCPSLAAGLAPGDSATCTADATYTVKQADIDAGHVDDTATASGRDTHGDSTPDDASSVTLPAAPAAPGVELDKQATVSPAAHQGKVEVGDSVTYSYAVRNVGNVTLASVSVDDPTLGAVDCPAPPAPGLAPGDSIACTGTVTHVVTQADVDAGQVANEATASGIDAQGHGTPDSEPSRTSLPADDEPSLSLVKTAAVSPAAHQGAAKAGDTISYALEVTNTSRVDIAKVAISDPTLGGVTCPVPKAPGLAPGASLTCTGDVTHTVTAADQAAGSISNTATATGTTAGGKSARSNASTARVPIAADAAPPPPGPGNPAGTSDLGITKKVDHMTARVGETLTYTLTVTNAGPDPATEAKVTDKPPAGLTVLSAKPATGSCAVGGGAVTCALGTVAKDASVKVTITARPTKAGALKNTAVVAATTIDPNHANDSASATTTVASVAAPRLTKVAGRRIVRPGQTITYRLRVRNPNATALVRTRVCDRLPHGLLYLASAPVAPHTATGYCWTLATLKAHATKTLTIRVTPKPGATGTITNRATAKALGTHMAHARATVRVRSGTGPCADASGSGRRAHAAC